MCKCNQIKMKSLGWVLIQYDWILIRKGKHCLNTDTQGKWHVTVGTEIQVLQLKAKKCQRSPGKSQETRKTQGRRYLFLWIIPPRFISSFYLIIWFIYENYLSMLVHLRPLPTLNKDEVSHHFCLIWSHL